MRPTGDMDEFLPLWLLQAGAASRRKLTAGRNHGALAGPGQVNRGQVRVAHVLNRIAHRLRDAPALEHQRTGVRSRLQMTHVVRGALDAGVQLRRAARVREVRSA